MTPHYYILPDTKYLYSDSGHYPTTVLPPHDFPFRNKNNAIFCDIMEYQPDQGGRYRVVVYLPSGQVETGWTELGIDCIGISPFRALLDGRFNWSGGEIGTKRR